MQTFTRIYIFLVLLFSTLCATKSIAQTVDFTVSIPSKQGCSPLSINFTDASTGGTVATRTWDLGNGVIIPNAAATVGANYITAQTYTVKLTVTFTNGVTASKTDFIIVHPKPVADFASADSIGCAPHNTTFQNLSTTSTGTINNWQWDFGAGGISGNFPTPTFGYTNTGQYQVALIVKNSWGCVSDAKTKPQYIKVFSPPSAYFTVNPNYTCSNSFTATFTNASTGGDPTRNKYEWDFGDLSPLEFTTNATHLYTGTGNYTATLKLKLGNNCVSTYTYPIYVGKPTGTITTFTDEVCENTAINFVGTGSANTYYLRWYFPDNGQTQYYGNVTHTFTSTGTFELLLIARNYAGCEDTVRRNILVKPGPQISFTPDKPDANCKPHTVTFTNNTIGINLKFAWDYGDGSPVDTINGQGNAVHTYNNFGYYTVTLYAKDTSIAAGCFAYKTFSYIRIIQPYLTLYAVPPSGCLPLPVSFSVVPGNIIVPILSYDWNFGDGSPVVNTLTATSSHIYNTAGSFPSTVTINMQGGCSYPSAVKIITVDAVCDDDGSGSGGAGGGGFTIGKTCADKYTILFKDTVTNSLPQSWNFGDGNIVSTGILNPISHTYTGPQKIYTVTVTRKDTITNVITTGVKRIKIIDEKAKFIPNIFGICKDKNVLFATIDIDSSLIKNYTWDFGDGSPRFTINNALYYSYYGIYLNGNTNHTYINNGVFYVKLIIEDKLGCLDSLLYPVPISVAGPIARFTAAPLTSCTTPLPVTITSNSTQNGSTPITEWQWTFGDGTPLLTTTVDSVLHHNYTGASPASFYTLKLKIKDAIGCEADTTRVNYVRVYKPIADFFSYNTLQCGNYQILLYGYISAAVNPTYQWDFGDGILSAPSTNYFAYHTYATEGNYSIKLIIVDENGCKDSITKPAYINIVKPVADFKINDTLQCAPASIIFADSSKYATSYLWDFGDGSGPSTSPNPAPHIYGTPGYYNVKLTITGPNGCTDFKIKQIRVRGPIGNLSAGASQGCRPYTLSLNITGGNFINTYAWDYGDGTPVIPSTTGASVNHVYNFAGKYLPNVVLTSPEGCPFTLKVTDTIFVDSLRAKFTTTQNVFCQTSTSQLVTFNNLTTFPSFSSLFNSTWNFGDGQTLSSTASSVPHTYTGYGTFNVYLATKSMYGCIDTFRLAQPIIINAKPIPAIIGANVYCLKPNTVLSYIGTVIPSIPIIKYIWKIDADSVANTKDLNINYRTAGTHTLRYIVQTDKGCIDSIEKIIIVDSVVAKFTNTPTQFCGPKLISFTNTSTNFAAIQNYLWTFGDGTTDNTNLSPSHLYAYTGSYNVKLFMQTVNGCKDSITKNATVIIDSIPTPAINGTTVFCLKPLSRLTFTSNVVTLNPITSYKWFIDNVQVATTQDLDIDYRIPGNHVVKLFVETSKGCNNFKTKNFIVDSVVAKFTNTPTQFCGPKLIPFTNTSTNFAAIQNYLWTFGDGATDNTNLSPSHLYAYTGGYNVKLFMQTVNGCTSDTTVPIAVKIDSIPTPAINGATVFCLKPSSRLTFTSDVVTLNPITSYKWFVDNVQVATTQDLDIDYRIPGNHVVKLFVETNKGCNNFKTQNFIVDSVVAKFTNTPTQFCGPKLIPFTNTSTNFAAIQNYLWTFGDGATDNTNLSPSHFYAYTGGYNVKLFMQTVNGCTSDTIMPIAVKIDSIPTPAINGATVFCLKPLSRLTFTSDVVTLNPITSYKWFVDNVQVATTQDLDIDYRIPGNHVVKLFVETNKGCNNFKTQNFIVDSVVAKFTNTPTQFCGPKLIPFTNTSTNFAAIQNYLWSFGDGATDNTNLSPSHFYSYTGGYNVKLFMQTVNGCTSDTIVPIAVKIDSIPTPAINGATVFCLKPLSRLTFTSAVVTLNPIATYKWFIDNVQVATTQDLDIDYRIPGNHVVKLFVETSKGCNNFITKNFIVDSVVAKFTNTLTQFCGPKLIPFTNTSTNFAAIQNYLWTFGDGATDNTNLSPSHFYAYTGGYNVKLFMQTVNGCTSDTIVPIAVKIDSIPKAKITGNALECKPGLYSYSSNTSISQNTISSYQWKVDGNIVGNASSLSYYFNAGNHIVSLKIKASTGCEHDTTKTIIIDSVKAIFTPIDVKICGNNGSIQFNNTGGGQYAIDTYNWSFGDGQFNNISPNPLHAYTQPGEYDVKLKLKSNNGCADSVTIVKAIKIYKKPAANIDGDVVKCSPNNYTYNSDITTQNPIDIYKWNVNNIEVANTINLNYNFTAGQKDLKLIVITDKGCTDTAYKIVKIDSLVATYNIPNPIKCGVPSDINFINTAYAKFGIQTYLWTFGNGSTVNNNLPNPTSTYNTSGVFTTGLKIISTTNCDKTSTQISNVTIYNKPVVTITGLASACANTTILFKGFTNGTGDQVINKVWKVNNIVAGNVDTLEYLFTTAGNYIVSFNVKTQYGCDVKEEKLVTINPIPIPNATPQQTNICLGKSILLNAATGINFIHEWTSFAQNTLANANTATPTATPIVDTKYYVLVTNQFGCKKTDSVFIKVDKPVNLTHSNNVTICEKASTRLNANGNTNNFVWTPSAGLDNASSRNPLASPAATTTYQVVGYSNNVCKNDTANITVFIDPTPTVNLGADITPNAGTVVQLNAVASSTVTNYLWSPTTGLSCTTCPKPSFIADKSITYKVEVFTQYGCKNADEIMVKVLCGKGAIYIPNAFTPNGDNKNDRFAVLGYGIGKVKSFTVFNRYGEVVFQRKDFVPVQNDKVNSWDGKVKGQDIAMTTVFVYITEVQCEEGQTFVLKNTITLIR